MDAQKEAIRAPNSETHANGVLTTHDAVAMAAAALQGTSADTLAAATVSETPFKSREEPRDLTVRLANGIVMAGQVWGDAVGDTEAVRVFAMHGWLDK
jgi:hypothetical protein